MKINNLIKRFSLYLIGLISPTTAGRIATRFFTTPTRVPQPPREEEYLKSAQAITLKSGYRGFVWGKGETRGNILLVHGWNGRGSQLGMFGQVLSEVGYTVYAFDGPAHGLSPGQTTNPLNFAEFIMTVANEVGGVVGIIGHSFGAGSAVFAVSKGLKIDKLVYIAGPYYYKDILDEFANYMKLTSPVRKAFYANVQKLVNIPLEEMVIGKFLKNEDVKKLIIHDEQDDVVPVAVARQLHQDWDGSELFITNGLGHRKILHDPVVADKVREFFVK